MSNKHDPTIHDHNGMLMIEYTPTAEEQWGSSAGPFSGICKSFTAMELVSLDEELYHNPDLKIQLLEAAKKSRFKRMLVEEE